jgi:dethiobiotin synthetase
MTGRVLLIHGTDTGVGKTVATAALATAHRGLGRRVLAVKIAQAGLENGRSDAEEVARLAAVDTVEIIRLSRPMAPHIAARLERVALPSLSSVLARLRTAAEDYDVVLVEGSGGVMVPLTEDQATLPDVGRRLSASGTAVHSVVVTRPGLGTLNHTGLTVEHLRHRGLTVSGLVLGTWPEHPTLVEEENRRELPLAFSVPIVASLPDGCPAWGPERFQEWVSRAAIVP